ncbi:hypothetical protein GUJ93_ZPchr0002g26566 [Zizania palustris]|uniref:DUF7769 domain-containing protein n=1 Tax=Zizania palustris TaxID=103762 RepID=A0A8J5RV49_ZIZPA|nr:hypothetical protein GUJ93_ZPchr0002g26566 [Zizania palustris]
MAMNIQVEQNIFADFDLNLEPPSEDAIGFDLNLEAPHDGLDLNLPPEDDHHNTFQSGLDLNVEPCLTVARRKELSNEDRKRIYQTLLTRSTNGKLMKHVTKDVAEQFEVHIRTVQRIWDQVEILLLLLLVVVVLILLVDVVLIILHGKLAASMLLLLHETIAACS